MKFSVEREAEMAAVEQRRKLRELRTDARKQAEGNAKVLDEAAKVALRENLANVSYGGVGMGGATADPPTAFRLLTGRHSRL